VTAVDQFGITVLVIIGVAWLLWLMVKIMQWRRRKRS
jgi:hypothetical protein